jgi:hypothetical protein
MVIGELHVPASLTRRKSPRQSLERNVEPQNPPGRYGEAIILGPTGCRTPTPRSSNPHAVAISTGLTPLYIVYDRTLKQCCRLCGLVVRVLGYRSEGPGSIPGTTRKKKVVGLERGPLSLVSTTEELFDRNVEAPV